MRALWLCCLLVAASAAEVKLPFADGSTLLGSEETVRGSEEKVWAFRGIPFAVPPEGNMRWRPPMPQTVPAGTEYNALQDRPQCWEVGNPFAQPPPANASQLKQKKVEMSEDCLYLSVYMPANPGPDPLPVIFWIHGGAYAFGAGQMPEYDPKRLMLQGDMKVVVVSIHYRLHVFGFLSRAILRPRADDSSTGNYAIQDQQLAMKWVQQYIHHFNGNPGVVTLLGESAGAASAATHMVIPGSKGLFHRAIMQSGGFSIWGSLPKGAAEPQFDTVADKVGCPAGSDEVRLECLLATKADILNTAAETGSLFGEPCLYHTSWQPTIDGVVLTKHQWESLYSGEALHVPVIWGFNEDEGVAFNTDVFMNDAGYYKAVDDFFPESKFPQEVRDKVKYELFPVDAYEEGPCYLFIFCVSRAWKAYAAVFGIAAFDCSTRTGARMMHNTGNEVFVYNYRKKCVIPDAFFPLPGAAPAAFRWAYHSCELRYVFDTEEAEDDGLAQGMGRYWANFARTGNPNEGAAVPTAWAPYSPADGRLMVFGDDGSMTMEHMGEAWDLRCNEFDALWNDMANGCMLPDPTARNSTKKINH